MVWVGWLELGIEGSFVVDLGAWPPLEQCLGTGDADLENPAVVLDLDLVVGRCSVDLFPSN